MSGIQVCTFLFYICAKLLNYVQVWLCEKPGFEHYFLKHVCDHICTVFFFCTFFNTKDIRVSGVMLCNVLNVCINLYKVLRSV